MARWRRSLQTRVVVTTLLVSGVVVALLASLLLGQVGRGLVSAKTRVALTEAQSGLAQAEDTLSAGAGESPQALEARLQDVAQSLFQRGQSGDQFTVLLVPASGDAKSFGTKGTTLADVPERLVDALDKGSSSAYVYDTVHGRDALVVGATLTTDLGPYQLYHLFPLTAEDQTLGLVRRTAAVAGLLLVLLLALIAGLVTRQVVLPVRLAARTAERLAAGRLEERMTVRGEDEIARLATTFNSMASALQTQIRQLEDLSRVQRRFVSDVSHELRTPLTTVRMAADVLHERRADLDPPAARSAELLQKELDRFEELLIDLLEISRYDAGAASLDAERQDLVALVHRVVEATRALAERKGSTIEVRSSGPAVAEVDHVRVERIIRNLLVNAVEHGEGRPVEVTVADGVGGVAVLVRDHGVGLEPGAAALVFTRFWRGDPSRARTTGGSGLGLAIALEDARLHGGSLQAWGAPGQGAAFRLTLPHTVGGSVGESPLALRPEVPA
ncbi:MAG TPA: MtrAB system histidine kinase MtrB [Mycobacteriales bacterium]|nr:MtrAB system histidine kinase MtrB [Mycobacteriales bacterium]